jgi:RNA polymerase sigma-70 factor (sigma-E family)
MELLGVLATDDVENGVRVTDPDYADFYAVTWPRMYRTAYAIARDAATAEDALQSAYAKAYASWRRVSGADEPEAYLRRMVVNEVLGARRWAARRPEHLTDAVDTWDSPTSPPDQQVADRDALWSALGRLAPRQRAVLVLRYYEGLSEIEIAEVLGCSRGTVKSQAADALNNLRRMTGLTEGNQS